MKNWIQITNVINIKIKILVIAIIGNKYDLHMKEQVSQEEAKEYAESIGAYFRLVSAKDGTGIPNYIHDLLHIIRKLECYTDKGNCDNNQYLKKKERNNGKCFK